MKEMTKEMTEEQKIIGTLETDILEWGLDIKELEEAGDIDSTYMIKDKIKEGKAEIERLIENQKRETMVTGLIELWERDIIKLKEAGDKFGGVDKLKEMIKEGKAEIAEMNRTKPTKEEVDEYTRDHIEMMGQMLDETIKEGVRPQWHINIEKEFYERLKKNMNV